jgi:hypothetical protein
VGGLVVVLPGILSAYAVLAGSGIAQSERNETLKAVGCAEKEIA